MDKNENWVGRSCGRCYDPVGPDAKQVGGIYFHPECHEKGLAELRSVDDIAARFGLPRLYDEIFNAV